MKLTQTEELVYELRQKGYTYSDISKTVSKSSAYTRTIYLNVKWVKEKEKNFEVATLNISPSTFRRFYNLICQYRAELFLRHMNLFTIDGVAKAINENKFKAFNKKMTRGQFTDKMIDEFIIALEEKGYEMKHNYSRMSNKNDIGIHLTSEMICNHSERIIKFDILDFSGILTCQHDGSDPHVYLSKPSRYNHKTISDQVITLMKKEGYII